MKKIIINLLIVLNFNIIFAFAPGISFEILNAGVGARIYSLGGFSATNYEDASLILLNPACLDLITKNEIFLSYETLYSNAFYNFLSYTSPVGKLGGIGIGLGYANYGTYEKMDKEGNSLGETSTSDLFFVAAYGRSLFWGIQMGLNLKVAIKNFGNETFTGYNSDIGFFKSFDIAEYGLILKNILPIKIKFNYEEEKILPAISSGIKIKLFDENLKIILNVEKYFEINYEPEISAGLEYNILNTLAIRIGANTNKFLASGLGVKYENFSFDYAISLNEVAILHKVSAYYRFGGYETNLIAEPKIFSPLSANKKTYIRINVKTKYDIYKWKVELKNKKGEIIKTWDDAGNPPNTIVWDGLKPDGMPYPEGEYYARLIITDENDTVIKSNEIEIKLSSSDKFFMPLIGE